MWGGVESRIPSRFNYDQISIDTKMAKDFKKIVSFYDPPQCIALPTNHYVKL